MFAFVSAPIDTPSFPLGSLDGNRLCGLYKDKIHGNICFRDRDGNDTYTDEGITELFEALKGSTVTLLKCAAACSLFCQRSLRC